MFIVVVFQLHEFQHGAASSQSWTKTSTFNFQESRNEKPGPLQYVLFINNINLEYELVSLFQSTLVNDGRIQVERINQENTEASGTLVAAPKCQPLDAHSKALDGALRGSIAFRGITHAVLSRQVLILLLLYYPLYLTTVLGKVRSLTISSVRAGRWSSDQFGFFRFIESWRIRL